MRTAACICIAWIALSASPIGKKQKLAPGRSFPHLNMTTLNGTVVDSSFFNGKITLVSFWRIGCLPSMMEIPAYNELIGRISDPRFQVISLSPHTRDELHAFYGEDTASTYVKVREALGSDVPRYDVIPMCSTRRSQDPSEIGVQCNTLKKLLDIDSYPVTLVVGPDRVIRHQHKKESC
jgi:thiol-disulfide isomerase/thioredoxin